MASFPNLIWVCCRLFVGSVDCSCRGHVDSLILISCGDHTLKSCLAVHCDVWDQKLFLIIFPVS